jgi:hypothetical protein
MFGSTILEVAIGLTFIYILLAILVSEVIEALSRARHWRSGTLEEGIRTMLCDPGGRGLAGEVLSHPLIKRLSRSGRPSYIPSKNFALALLDQVSSTPAQVDETFDSLKAEIFKMPDGDLKTVLLSQLNDADGKIDRVRENVAMWFDDSMVRVSGWYNRKTRLVGLILAIIVTVAINADSLMISNTLVKNDALRDTLVETAANPEFTEANLSATVAVDCAAMPQHPSCQIEQLALPVGWDFPRSLAAAGKDWPAAADRGIPRGTEWVTKFIGLLITAVAVSLGAPFWFQFLGQLLSLRQGLHQGGMRQSGAPPPLAHPRHD